MILRAGQFEYCPFGNIQDFLTGLRRVLAAESDLFNLVDEFGCLSVSDDVQFAVPDRVITGRQELIPNDPLFPQLWGLDNTGQFGGTPGICFGSSV